MYGISDAVRGDFTGSVPIGLLGLRCACASFLWFTIPNPLVCAPPRAELGLWLIDPCLAQDEVAGGSVPAEVQGPWGRPSPCWWR